MTKHELIAELTQRYPQYTTKEMQALVDTVFASLTEALAKGERIELRGFGSFELRSRAARQARNPKTRAAVAVAAKRVPFFKVGKALRLRVHGGESQEPGISRRGQGEPRAGQEG
jgi:integration host factor subunit beta